MMKRLLLLLMAAMALTAECTSRSPMDRYIDELNDPLYPFRYGLSYTSFPYSNVLLSASEMLMYGEVIATVTAHNTGNRDCQEIAQLYILNLVDKETLPYYHTPSNASANPATL